MKKRTIYRTVGFTDSTYAGSGAPELGYSGRFFNSRDEAEQAGCGKGEGLHCGKETREYTRLPNGTVLVDGDEATESCAREVRQWMRNNRP